MLLRTTFTKLALAHVMIAFAGCSRPAPGGSEAPTVTAPPATTSTAPVTVATSSPNDTPVTKQQEIFIDSVTVANPIVVNGRARTFENTVSVRARDARGRLITEEYVTSVGEMGRHNPYTAHLWIVRDPGEQITVEAFEYSAKDGSIRSLTGKTVTYDVERIPATLILPVGDCTKMGEFSRRMPKAIAMARLLSEALVHGPTESEKAAGATSPFPAGSDVRSVVLRNGVVTVDFNERLQNVGGSCAVTGIRESVVRTLTMLPTVKRVTISAAGSHELALQP